MVSSIFTSPFSSLNAGYQIRTGTMLEPADFKSTAATFTPIPRIGILRVELRSTAYKAAALTVVLYPKKIAGDGVEPPSSGNGPDELPLLYPAM